MFSQNGSGNGQRSRHDTLLSALDQGPSRTNGKFLVVPSKSFPRTVSHRLRRGTGRFGGGIGEYNLPLSIRMNAGFPGKPFPVNLPSL